MYLQMTEYEIRRSYREAKDPKAQIKILADLNCCRTSDINKIIETDPDNIKQDEELYKIAVARLEELEKEIDEKTKEYQEIAKIITGVRK